MKMNFTSSLKRTQFIRPLTSQGSKARPVDIPDGHAEKRRLSTLHQPISNSIDEATM
jgi:hypothetical protein